MESVCGLETKLEPRGIDERKQCSDENTTVCAALRRHHRHELINQLGSEDEVNRSGSLVLNPREPLARVSCALSCCESDFSYLSSW